MNDNFGGAGNATGRFPDAPLRPARELAQAADAASQKYERAAWIGYAGIFLMLPFAVLVFRLHMQAWHYYLAGALFITGALVSCAIDIVAMARRDEAERAVPPQP